jgi:hypothetical protein
VGVNIGVLTHKKWGRLCRREIFSKKKGAENAEDNPCHWPVMKSITQYYQISKTND